MDPIAGGGGGEMDAFSFDDSDRFEDDSVCSWISEPESVVNNWRGWRKPSLAATSLPTGGAPLLAAPLVGASSGNCGKIRYEKYKGVNLKVSCACLLRLVCPQKLKYKFPF